MLCRHGFLRLLRRFYHFKTKYRRAGQQGHHPDYLKPEDMTRASITVSINKAQGDRLFTRKTGGTTEGSRIRETRAQDHGKDTWVGSKPTGRSIVTTPLPDMHRRVDGVTSGNNSSS